MDEMLKKSLAELLEYIKQGANFIERQAPLVAQEYLRYHKYQDIIAICLGIILILSVVAWIVMARKYHNNWYSGKYDQLNTVYGGKSHPEYFNGWFFLMIPSFVIGTALVINFSLDLVKINTAPRLYVLEGIKKLF